MVGAELGARQIESFTHSVFMLYAPGPGLAAGTNSKRLDLLVSALPPCQLHSVTQHDNAKVSKWVQYQKSVYVVWWCGSGGIEA